MFLPESIFTVSGRVNVKSILTFGYFFFTVSAHGKRDGHNLHKMCVCVLRIRTSNTASICSCFFIY